MRSMHPGLLLGLAALLLLPAPAVTLAQSGGGYDLTWWTADVGGGPATGAAYALHGSTAGQPEPGPLMTGGEYTLAGGFWPGGPAQPRAVADLRGSRSGNALRLDWTAVTSDVEGNSISGVAYDIYRGVDAPYFTPAARYASTSNNWYLDAGVIGDTGHSYYYLVRAVYSRMGSADSNRVGCFSFALTPGSY